MLELTFRPLGTSVMHDHDLRRDKAKIAWCASCVSHCMKVHIYYECGMISLVNGIE